MCSGSNSHVPLLQLLASGAIFPYQFPRLARDLAALAPDIVLTEIHLESYPALNPNRLWVPLFYPLFLTLRFCSSTRSPWFQSWRRMLTPTHSSSFSPSSLSRAIFPATSIFRPIYDESPRSRTSQRSRSYGGNGYGVIVRSLGESIDELTLQFSLPPRFSLTKSIFSRPHPRLYY